MTRTLKDHFMDLTEISKEYNKTLHNTIKKIDKETSSIDGKRALFICEYLLKEIMSMQDDVSYRTELLAENMEQIRAIQKDVIMIKEQQKYMNEGIQKKMNERAEQIKRENEENETKLKKGLPGVG